MKDNVVRELRGPRRSAERALWLTAEAQLNALFTGVHEKSIDFIESLSLLVRWSEQALRAQLRASRWS
jgi:hypothetical protein